MTREDFDRHLQTLQEELLVMGSMVEEAISRSTDALKNRNLALARQVIADDLKINQKRYDHRRDVRGPYRHAGAAGA